MSNKCENAALRLMEGKTTEAEAVEYRKERTRIRNHLRGSVDTSTCPWTRCATCSGTRGPPVHRPGTNWWHPFSQPVAPVFSAGGHQFLEHGILATSSGNWLPGPLAGRTCCITVYTSHCTCRKYVSPVFVTGYQFV